MPPRKFPALPSGKLTYLLKIGLPKRRAVFQPSFFRGYVNFLGFLGCIGGLIIEGQ